MIVYWVSLLPAEDDPKAFLVTSTVRLHRSATQVQLIFFLVSKIGTQKLSLILLQSIVSPIQQVSYSPCASVLTYSPQRAQAQADSK